MIFYGFAMVARHFFEAMILQLIDNESLLCKKNFNSTAKIARRINNVMGADYSYSKKCAAN